MFLWLSLLYFTWNPTTQLLTPGADAVCVSVCVFHVVLLIPDCEVCLDLWLAVSLVCLACEKIKMKADLSSQSLCTSARRETRGSPLMSIWSQVSVNGWLISYLTLYLTGMFSVFSVSCLGQMSIKRHGVFLILFIFNLNKHHVKTHTHKERFLLRF